MLMGCKQQTNQANDKPLQDTTYTVKYANFFSIKQEKNYILLTVKFSANNLLQYGLYAKNTAPPALPQGCQPIAVPIEKAALYSTTYANVFEAIGCGSVIKGFAGTNYLFSPALRQAVAKGHIVEIGTTNQPNVEWLSQLRPDIVMMYVGANDADKLSLLQRLRLKVVVNSDFMESHPLGRAEWIKVAGLLCNKKREADSIFNHVEKNYQNLAKKARLIPSKPTVFANIPYSGTWYMPGGNSFMATLLADAGANYLWQDQPITGSLPLSLEAAFAKIQQADYWINPGSMESLEMIRQTDPRFALLKAVQTGKVFNNNKRQLKGGGNDYWESGSTRPDLVLADLIAIFHPELLPHHQLVYFQPLR
ncbi:MAG: ABC transporter substrate-binding protein [Cytophagales bacterium]|nr:ABC transporter substrate-binding protein [Cytophagales bacterium]